MNPDQICADLKKVQKLKWEWREGKFDAVELLRHPEIERRASDPSNPEKRLDALYDLLKETQDRLARREEKEGEGEVNGNSVASVVGILLRLDKRSDRRSVKSLQEDVAKQWKGEREHDITWNTVRLHYEMPFILRPFARELLGLLDRPTGPDGSFGKEMEMLEHLEQMEKDRLRSIPREGKLEIRTEAEMLQILRKVINLATESLRGLDRTPIEHWFEEDDPLKEYLDEQLELVKEKGLFLERIYLVRRATLHDSDERDHLIEFVRRHEDAKATILLCRAETVARTPLGVDENRGMILVDDEGEPMAVTGKLKDGEIGEALLYTREQLEIDRLQAQYRRLRNRILTHHYDKRLREELGLAVRGE
jgi:hypothetical protein